MRVLQRLQSLPAALATRSRATRPRQRNLCVPAFCANLKGPSKAKSLKARKGQTAQAQEPEKPNLGAPPKLRLMEKGYSYKQASIITVTINQCQDEGKSYDEAWELVATRLREADSS